MLFWRLVIYPMYLLLRLQKAFCSRGLCFLLYVTATHIRYQYIFFLSVYCFCPPTTNGALYHSGTIRATLIRLMKQPHKTALEQSLHPMNQGLPFMGREELMKGKQPHEYQAHLLILCLRLNTESIQQYLKLCRKQRDEAKLRHVCALWRGWGWQIKNRSGIVQPLHGI